jgi:hypothetical protein
VFLNLNYERAPNEGRHPAERKCYDCKGVHAEKVRYLEFVALNAHYLTKSIKCLQDEIESAKETLGAIKKIKPEKQLLLMDVG